jgi:outer membrane protein assembly factor BamA
MLRAAVLACLWLAPSGPASAQGEPAEPPAASETPANPPTIGSLRVEGAVFTDTTRILRSFDVRPGQTFAPDLIRRGLRKLGSLGLFSDYRVNQVRREGENVVDLVIVVVERSRIAQISFEGS